ncbi:MAG: threonine--tRNA ligase [Candidatus Pacearchaeota archaeon]
MKILSLHCDYIKFKPIKKAIKEPEELSEERKKEIEVKEPLVIFTAVENCDEENFDGILSKYLENILDLKKMVKAERVVLYPYAHLSSNLSRPDFAQKLLEEAEKELVKQKIEVYRAPFGYYKEFELRCKGHPLAELSREIKLNEEPKSEGLEKRKIQREESYDYKKILASISKAKLDTSKLEKNDHRIIGQRLDLFSFHDVAPGMVFWHNNGLIIKKEIEKYWREEHKKEGYKEIETPQVLDKRLWQISGHWEKYKENIFLTEYEGREFAIKPMNCPGGMLVYKCTPKSYKDFPLRVAEIGIVHRQELSGVLGGLFRVIRITQDDAHIFCEEEQLEEEVFRIIQLAKRIYSKFNLNFHHLELSTRPEKRIGSDEIWDKAEEILENVLKKTKLSYKINPGDGAFYGPKIDFHLSDSQNRTWQTATIQLDMFMPERFDLTYIDRNGQKKRPVMLHRTILGSFERFIGILLESTNGNLPVWLSPIQVKVLSFTDRNVKSAEKILEKLKEEGIRAEGDFSSSTIGEKVRNAILMKVPYIITIGDKEEKNETVTIRKRGEEKLMSDIKLENFLKELKREINERL